MSAPGTGRYTAFVPTASNRNKLLAKLFNENSPKGDIYGAAYQSNQAAAAAAAVATATSNVSAGVGGIFPSDGKQSGDPNIFPTGVDISYGAAPNLNDVKWNKAGDPANAYVPDLSSPGAGKTSPLDKDKDPGIEIADVKGEKYIPGAPDTGTASPSTYTPAGVKPSYISPVGKNLVLGKSSV